jgi:hypothetical protein
MSRDTTYQIKVTISSEKAAEIEKFLNEALPENSPTERKTIVVYEHLRNLGPACAGRYDKDVEEILQEAASAFPGASIEMQWSDEFGQEGSGSFYTSESMRQKMPSGDHKEEPEYIDLKVAQKFLDDPDSVNLSSAKGISDDAAEVLAQHEGELSLNGLTELTDAAALALAKHNVGYLSLNGLTHLTYSVALALSNREETLEFGGLTKLTEDVAKALAKHKWSLILPLDELSDSVAEALAKSEAFLYLDWLTELTESAAKALSKHKTFLSLEGLTELSDAVAHALVEHEGDLRLDADMIELSDAAAEALSRKKGTINETDPAEWVESLQS